MLEIVSILVVFLFLLLLYSYFKLLREKKILLDKNNNLENQLVAQSRNAVMGEMMMAIVHQWKQPLNSIAISNSSVDMHILMDDFDKELLSEQTSNIDDQIVYMNSTLNDFRNFFKVQPRSCFEIKNCIDDVLKLVGKVYAVQKVDIKLELTDGLFVDGYPNELNQVLINIFNNARDIIVEKKPKIKDIVIKSYLKEDKVILTISDLAGGIPTDILNKIFDPYVTTKDDDKGTGIGLDMSKTIIEKVDGTIEATNITKNIDGEKHQGASFIITLNSCKI
ncbi:MAG: HAMP domain-containing sensor histidine kinase [Campylobacterota bacterium]|nr:HAMP domain-containing sensor histidine kinase [Campylobacterota bacterium]